MYVISVKEIYVKLLLFIMKFELYTLQLNPAKIVFFYTYSTLFGLESMILIEENEVCFKKIEI